MKDAGAASVCHIASIAAIFIFWFCPAVYPLSSPSTTTESAEANPKLAAIVMERIGAGRDYAPGANRRR